MLKVLLLVAFTICSAITLVCSVAGWRELSDLPYWTSAVPVLSWLFATLAPFYLSILAQTSPAKNETKAVNETAR